MNSWKQALTANPGRDLEAQRRFAVHLPDGSRAIDPDEPPAGSSPREAAVVVLLSDAAAPRLTLIRRTEDGGVHSGQIAFPGGSREPIDASLEATALRETEEELGIGASELDVVRALAPVYIPPSNFVVTPFIALHHGRPSYRPDPLEVAEVIELPLAGFLDPNSVARELWTLRGQPYLVPHYRLAGHKVWGATARMVAMVVRALSDAELAQTT